MRVKREAWRLGIVALVCTGFFGAASAQEAPRLVPGPNGPEVHGSITVDGVTYTAEDLLAIAEAMRNDPASLPADLPGEVRAAAYSLAPKTLAPAQPSAPASGGAP